MAIGEQSRVCIVGGGAAGLSLAWYLRTLGVTSVVVLESAGRAGGKCWTRTFLGQSYDVGAVITSWYYSHVRSLAKAVGTRTRRLGRPFRGLEWRDGVASGGPIGIIFRKVHSRGTWLRIVLRYLRAWYAHRAVLETPGFAGIAGSNEHASLAGPFGDWARDHGVEPILHLFRVPVLDMGYGDTATVPAAYVLKYMNPATVVSLMVASLAPWSRLDRVEAVVGGFGRLFEELAARMDVRLNSQVTGVTRGDSIEVAWTHDGVAHTEAFDAVVVTCDPRAAARFMDWTDTERETFEGVRSNDYVVTVCELVGHERFENFYTLTTGNPNGPHSGGRQRRDSQVAHFYSQPTLPNTDETLVAIVEAEVPQLFPGATVKQQLAMHRYEYFPHVDCQRFAGGFYDRIEALQGQRGTWYGGGLLAFESVETVVRYSEALAKRMTR